MGDAWTELDRALEAATRKMWAELSGREISFHGFGICLPEGGDGVRPFVHTRATLVQVIADRCGPDTEVTEERLLEFAVDPAFWWEAAAEFEPLFAKASKLLYAIECGIPSEVEDTRLRWEEQERKKEDLVLSLLQRLDKEGLFGRGAEREQVCIFLHRWGWSLTAEMDYIVPRLNPGTAWGKRLHYPVADSSGKVEAIGPILRDNTFEQILIGARSGTAILRSQFAVEVRKLTDLGEPEHRVDFNYCIVNGAVFHPDDQYLLIASRAEDAPPGRRVQRMDLRTGELVPTAFDEAEKPNLRRAAACPESGHLAVGAGEVLRMFNRDDRLITSLPLETAVADLVFADKGDLFVLERERISFFEPESWERVGGMKGSFERLALSPDGKTIAVAQGPGKEHIILLFNADFTELGRIVVPDHYGPEKHIPLYRGARQLAFSPCGKTLAAAVGYGETHAEARVFSVQTQEELGRFNECHLHEVARPVWEDSDTVWLTGHHERGASAYRWHWRG